MFPEFPWFSKILGSLLTIILFYLFALLSRRLSRKFISDNIQRYRANKRISFIMFVSAIIFIALIWAESIGSITTMLGLLSAGIALALKDPISSIVGWFDITGAKLYSVGDRIEIWHTKGDVIDISLMTTSLIEIGNWVDGEQSTGRIVRFPNNWVFTHDLYNYTQAFPYIWTEVNFTITFESDWRKASEIFTDVLKEIVGDLPREVERAVRQAQEKFLIHYRNFDPIVYFKIEDSGIKLVGRFLIDVRRRRTAESNVFTNILKRIDTEKKIILAYTTYRIIK
ncbi:mechanosensitive ion channel family protein [bacterium]|nr:mechanosensitive ion channel family protein [bacterium]